MSRPAAATDAMTQFFPAQRPAVSGASDASVAIRLIDIDNAEESLCAMEKKTPRLSWRERMDFETTSNWNRARIRHGAHIALRLVLERWLGASAVRAKPYDVNPNGKPFLSGSGLDFSLSYSNAMVLIGLRAGGAIGVDLECERSVRMDVARQNGIIAAANSLCDTRNNGQGCAQTDTFLQAWTRMEAAAKATGLGIGRLLGQFGLIGPVKPDRAQGAEAVAQFVECYDLAICDLAMARGFYGSVAQVRGTVVPDLVEMPCDLMDLQDFVDDERQRR